MDTLYRSGYYIGNKILYSSIEVIAGHICMTLAVCSMPALYLMR